MFLHRRCGNQSGFLGEVWGGGGGGNVMLCYFISGNGNGNGKIGICW